MRTNAFSDRRSLLLIVPSAWRRSSIRVSLYTSRETVDRHRPRLRRRQIEPTDPLPLRTPECVGDGGVALTARARS